MPNRASNNLGTIATVAVLLALLAAALWYAASAFVVGGPPMPTIGYVAMAGGIIISLAVGFALMGLLFYSSRHGYDEPKRFEPDDQP
jgi:cation transporter-like permease